MIKALELLQGFKMCPQLNFKKASKVSPIFSTVSKLSERVQYNYIFIMMYLINKAILVLVFR